MKVVYAACTMWISSDVQIVEGEAWRADDPVVQRRPELFKDTPKVVRTTLPRHLRQERPVEQATAAPGEMRATKPRADRAADEVEQLQAQLAALGVKVDGRWSLNRLRDELAKAQAGA